MSNDDRKPTNWFDSKIDDLKGEFDKLAGGSSGSRLRHTDERGGSSVGSSETVRRTTEIAPPPKVAPPKVAQSHNATASTSERTTYTPLPSARREAPTRESRSRPATPATTSGPRTPAPREAPKRRAPSGSGYMLGVDVGGTFTDLLLIEEATGQTFTAKVPSTPSDSSIGVLNGIERICETAGIDTTAIGQVMHGTTVATNTVLTGSGARVGLVTTKGYGQTLQIARSYVPGGLGGWVIFNKSDPLAPLELTIEADERIDADGSVHEPLDESAIRRDLEGIKGEGIEALTISLMNAYTNGEHEQKIREIAQQVLPGVPISISSEIVPEMYEYERTETTVVNSYIRPVVGKYIENLSTELDRRMGGVNLHILRSDGGLASGANAKEMPVNLLMSGPAGGVSGAIFMAKQAGFKDLLTFDMGGTSTDVALIQGGIAQTRRETRVADVTVRAPSVDVRTVGAGGGSIAYVPELTKALRVGPQSAGAEPGPAAYGKGGDEPTVTDANVVLGYLPSTSKLGGDMHLDRSASERVIKKIADALGLGPKEAAEGIINIVNENMFGALRLVSVEQGFDPRDFALIGFGGAGPLHANALGKLMNSWPVIIPPGPGVLCAYGDATTRVRNEAARTFVRRFDATSESEVSGILQELSTNAAQALDAEGVPRDEQTTEYQIDLRYSGQGMRLTVKMTPEEYASKGLAELGRRFDEMHEQMFTFSLDAPHELYNLRTVIQGAENLAALTEIPRGSGDPSRAVVEQTTVFHEGRDHSAQIYDRAALKAGDRIQGPAVVTEMDSTSLILPGHVGEVDSLGNVLINPA